MVNWYYKFFVYWKTHTSDFTSGKGKDFDLQFGPFDSLEAMEKDLMHNLNHNTLYSFNNYKDNNKIQLDNEIFIIGGGEIYQKSIILAHKIFLTRIHVEVDGDTYFPQLSYYEYYQNKLSNYHTGS